MLLMILTAIILVVFESLLTSASWEHSAMLHDRLPFVIFSFTLLQLALSLLTLSKLQLAFTFSFAVSRSPDFEVRCLNLSYASLRLSDWLCWWLRWLLLSYRWSLKLHLLLHHSFVLDGSCRGSVHASEARPRPITFISAFAICEAIAGVVATRRIIVSWLSHGMDRRSMVPLGSIVTRWGSISLLRMGAISVIHVLLRSHVRRRSSTIVLKSFVNTTLTGWRTNWTVTIVSLNRWSTPLFTA